jgi:hypothetical protein
MILTHRFLGITVLMTFVKTFLSVLRYIQLSFRKSTPCSPCFSLHKEPVARNLFTGRWTVDFEGFKHEKPASKFSTTLWHDFLFLRVSTTNTVCVTQIFVVSFNNSLMLRAALILGGSKVLIIRVNKPVADDTVSIVSLGNRTTANELYTAHMLLRITAVDEKCDDNSRLHDQTRPPAFSYKTISGNYISVVPVSKCDMGISLIRKHGRPTGRIPSCLPAFVKVSLSVSKAHCPGQI